MAAYNFPKWILSAKVIIDIRSEKSVWKNWRKRRLKAVPDDGREKQVIIPRFIKCLNRRSNIVEFGFDWWRLKQKLRSHLEPGENVEKEHRQRF